MAEGAQINPKIALATKTRLMAFCKERGHSQGEVVEAALEAYFTPADGDAQALMFQKLNDLEHGMKDVVTLLGAVIQHLEQQAKPLPPKIATPAEMYPELRRPVQDHGAEDSEPAAALAEVSADPTQSPWRRLWSRRAAV
jgi:hypothetical protein